MTTIICAVDGSADSATALHAASIIAERSNATLLVATVQPFDADSDRAEQLTAAHTVASDVMDSRDDIADARVVPLIGEPAIELAGLATEAQASMIVVGARGKGRARTTFRSRLQRELAEVATVPVVIAPSVPVPTNAAEQLRPEQTDGRPRTRRRRRTVRRWAEHTPAVRPSPTTR
jgi:K+-sensing histidine kinase KdpD